MPKSKRIMVFLTCLMMAGGVFYWLKNETGPPPSLLKASANSEAFLTAETSPERLNGTAGEGPETAEKTMESPAGTEAEWIYATEPLMVNINTADLAELEKLPGIGPAKAQAILAYRKAHGPFSNTEELMQVPGIKEATFARLKAYVTV